MVGQVNLLSSQQEGEILSQDDVAMLGDARPARCPGQHTGSLIAGTWLSDVGHIYGAHSFRIMSLSVKASP